LERKRESKPETMSSSGWERGGEGPQNIFYVDCLGLGILSKPFLFEEAKAWHKWPMEQFRCFLFFLLCLLALIQRMVISSC
jgi:hypothetical protein